MKMFADDTKVWQKIAKDNDSILACCKQICRVWNDIACDVSPVDVTDDVACAITVATHWIYIVCCEAALQVLRV